MQKWSGKDDEHTFILFAYFSTINYYSYSDFALSLCFPSKYCVNQNDYLKENTRTMTIVVIWLDDCSVFIHSVISKVIWAAIVIGSVGANFHCKVILQ